ncbi:hypothetical protein [Sphingobium sp. OAS761]|uniref:hypothetical protein n=1 Tax=Sphingobium sp. OAS761 TaxID=2817901 RepID=UPI00209DB70C|nr:hypothetical protein [Sphingobium sp. OAS761]
MDFAKFTAETFKDLGEKLFVCGHVLGTDRRDGVSPFGHGDDAVVAVSMLLRIGSEIVSGCADLVGSGRYYAGAALVRQLVDDPARRASNVSRSRRSGQRAMLGWQIAESWRADFGLTTQWLNVRDSQYAFRGLQRSTTRAEPHDNDFLAATVAVRGKLGELDLTSASAYVTHELRSIYDATARASALGLAIHLGFEERRLLRLATQEIRLSDPASRRPWVAG